VPTNPSNEPWGFTAWRFFLSYRHAHGSFNVLGADVFRLNAFHSCSHLSRNLNPGFTHYIGVNEQLERSTRNEKAKQAKH
jgi:hypothetical protein